eukprot:758592-Hanusia_phi.AAC.8
MAVPPNSQHNKGRQPNAKRTFNEALVEVEELLDQEVDMRIGDGLRGYLRNSSKDGKSEALVISSYNNKGGVLKTTTCVEVGYMLADMGFNVLLVDLDSQGSLTKSLLHLEDAIEDVTFRTRIRINKDAAAVKERHFCENLVQVDQNTYRLAGSNQTTNKAIRWELLDGLTEIVRPTGTNTAPEKVTPFLLQEAGRNTHIVRGDAALLENDSKLDRKTKYEIKKAIRVQNDINKRRRSDQGSIHLIIGHHDTSAIADRIAVANSNREVALYQRIHGSINWLIRQAAKDVSADIVLVDLNPDSSQLNRTVIMQSDYLLLSTWPDPDGVESVVDLNCRLMKGLRYENEIPTGEYPINQMWDDNKEAWIQMQQDFFHITQKNVAVENAELRVTGQMPVLLGILVHSKETQRDIIPDHRRYRDELENRYTSLITALRDHACVIFKWGPGQQLRARHLKDLRERRRPEDSQAAGGRYNMTVNHERAANVLGGIWNHLALKSLSKLLKKPISNIDVLDISNEANWQGITAEAAADFDGGEELEAGNENHGEGWAHHRHRISATNMLQIAEHRNRVHRIVRALLHNISLSINEVRPSANADARWPRTEFI